MSQGNYFEDFSLGQKIRHAVPRTVHHGDISLYIALTGERRAHFSSGEFAKGIGQRGVVVPDLLTFHIVFGKTVPDISFNAVANLGYADVQFLAPVYPGDTLRSETEVVGLRQTSSGKSGIVYVKSVGINQREEVVLSFYRWVLVNKKRLDVEVPTLVPELPSVAKVANAGYDFSKFESLQWATASGRRLADYSEGQRIVHGEGMTLEESDHMLATRLYQNTAKVHFDAHQMKDSRFGKRLVYGGHVISLAHSLAYRGLENAMVMGAWNGGSHANPTFAGDTLYALSEVVETQELSDRVGALRLKLYAIKNRVPDRSLVVKPSGKFDPSVVLELDYWSLIPR